MTRKERTRVPAPLVTGALLVAGITACAEGDPPAAEAEAPPDIRSLDAPPELQVGEWWTVRVEAGVAGAEYEATIVVTERDERTASIGVAAPDFSDDFFVVHVPPLGTIDLETLAWRVMWDDFEALRFPLEEGRSWEADFHGFDVEAEVTRVEGDRAHVTMTGEDERIELAYDARVGMITDFREEALQLGFRVIDHGFDFDGDVRTPTGIELALFEGLPGDAAAPDGTDIGAPATTVEVDTGHSHGSLGLVFSNPGSDGEPTPYRVAATAPDGTVFEETFTPVAGGPPLFLESFGHDVVNGTWRLEFEGSGPASALVELFTYDLTETRMGAR